MMSTETIIPVYGHQWAQELLRAAILAQRTSHAYLFTGPDRVGKTTLARAFAQALTCESPRDQGLGACGHCRSCRLAASRSHPDHHFISPEKGQIRVDAIRDMIREANLSPVEGRFKVFIISSFDQANLSAANALLKTLEEPSDTTRILLISSQAASLLPTITSRCQIVHLRPLSPEIIAHALQENWQIPTERATLLAGLSGGRLGWAVEMATQAASWNAYQEQLHLMETIVHEDVVARMSTAETISRTDDLEAALHTWLLFWRDVLLLQQAAPDFVLHRDRFSLLESLARQTSPSQVRRFLAALMKTAEYTHKNVNIRLALESLLLKVPGTS